MSKTFSKLLVAVLITAMLSAMVGCEYIQSSVDVLGDALKMYVDVTDYGAVGTDSVDDSIAFNAASTIAAKRNVPVYVPMGEYYIDDIITVEGTTLIGEVDGNKMTTLRHCTFNQVMICLKDAGSIENFIIESAYSVDSWDKENLGTKEKAFPEISVEGTGSQIKNLMINNPYIGILAGSMDDHETPCGRFHIENVKINQPFYAGICSGGGNDTSWIKNCVVFCPDTPATQGYWFGNNKELLVSNTRVYEANCGFNIHCVAENEEKKLGGCSCNILDCSAGQCKYGLRLGKGNHSVTASGCKLYSTENGVNVDASTDAGTSVAINNCNVLSENSQAVLLSGGKTVSFAGNTVYHTAFPETPAITVNGGRAVNVAENTVYSAGVGVQLACPVGSTGTMNQNKIFTMSDKGIAFIENSPLESITNNEIAINQTLEVYKARTQSRMDRDIEEFTVDDFSDAGNNISVVNHGANGNDEVDDTAAFEAAIAEASKNGLTVFVPAGTYIISHTVKIDKIDIMGYSCESWSSEVNKMPVIKHTVFDSPCFELSDGSDISGLCIESSYNEELFDDLNYNSSQPASPEIKILDRGTAVHDMKIINPFFGIAAGDPEETFAAKGVEIKRVYVKNPKLCGIYVGGTSDSSEISECMVKNNGDKRTTNGFWVGKNKDLYMSNLTSSNCVRGITATSVDSGTFEGKIYNCSVSDCIQDVYFGGGQHSVSVVGCSFKNSSYGVYVSKYEGEQSVIYVGDCVMQLTSGNCVQISNGKQVTIKACAVLMKSADVAVKVENAAVVNVVSNVIMGCGYLTDVSDANNAHYCNVGNNAMFTSNAETMVRSALGCNYSVYNNSNFVNQSADFVVN